MEDLVILTPHVISKTLQKLVSLQHLQVEAIRSSHAITSILLHRSKPMSPSTSLSSANFDQKWIGLKVHISDPEGTTTEWTLNQKIHERERDSDHHGKEARAIFRCTDADDKKCIMKVRML
jgi:hypothetical protein